VRSSWLTVSLFTPTISLAAWMEPQLLLRQVGFTVAGSRLIFLAPSRVSLAAALGSDPKILRSFPLKAFVAFLYFLYFL
jgi:hypothetical protein